MTFASRFTITNRTMVDLTAIEWATRRCPSDEWNGAEFKATKAALPKLVFETVSGFANTNGDWIILGVKNEEESPL